MKTRGRILYIKFRDSSIKRCVNKHVLYCFCNKVKGKSSGSILRIISQGKMAEIRPTAAPLHLTDDNTHVVHALLERRIYNKLYKIVAGNVA
jgi:hypothetical protein